MSGAILVRCARSVPVALKTVFLDRRAESRNIGQVCILIRDIGAAVTHQRRNDCDGHSAFLT